MNKNVLFDYCKRVEIKKNIFFNNIFLFLKNVLFPFLVCPLYKLVFILQ